MAALTLATFGMFTYPTLGPLFTEIYEWTPAQIGWLMSAFYIGATLTSMISGSLTDRYGTTRCLTAGLIIIGTNVFLASFPPWYGGKLVFIALAGVGYSLVNPAINKMVVVDFPDRIRATVMSLKQMGLSAGGMVAASLLPFLSVYFGWQSAVYTGAGLILAFVVYILLTQDEKKPDQRKKSKNMEAVSYRSILRDKNVLFISSAGLLLALAQFVSITYLVLFLQSERGLGFIEASKYLALYQFAGITGRFVWGWSSDYILKNRKYLMIIVTLCSALFLLGFVFLSQFTSGFLLGVLIFMLGFCISGWPGLYLTLLVSTVETEYVGKVTGFGMMLTYSGILIGPSLFGLSLNYVSFTYSWIAVAVLTVIAALLLTGMQERTEEEKAGQVSTQ
nr:MFS transporter [Evansella sp. LMS18]